MFKIDDDLKQAWELWQWLQGMKLYMSTHPGHTIETSGSIALAPRTDDALKPQAAPAEPLRRPRTPERTGTFHFHFSVLIFKIYLYVKFFSLSLYLILFQYISLNLNISHFILSYLIPQQYLICFHFPSHFITRSPQRKEPSSHSARRRRTERTESEECRRREERNQRRAEQEERMALIREEARKSEEEQRKLDAEARRAEESLREANELLEKERQDAFKRLCDQNDMLKEKINQLEVQTKKELQDMEEKMQKERQEMQEKGKRCKEEMPSEDEDLFNFTMFFPPFFSF